MLSDILLIGPTLRVYKSKNLGDFRHAEKATIYTAPSGTLWSEELWAPELHHIDGNFYVYYAADDGDNVNHKMYVLKAEDPLNPMGSYQFMGKIFDLQKDWWGIDGTVMKHRNGKSYYIYSGWVSSSKVALTDWYTTETLYFEEMNLQTS